MLMEVGPDMKSIQRAGVSSRFMGSEASHPRSPAYTCTVSWQRVCFRLILSLLAVMSMFTSYCLARIEGLVPIVFDCKIGCRLCLPFESPGKSDLKEVIPVRSPIVSWHPGQQSGT